MKEDKQRRINRKRQIKKNTRRWTHMRNTDIKKDIQGGGHIRKKTRTKGNTYKKKQTWWGTYMKKNT